MRSGATSLGTPEGASNSLISSAERSEGALPPQARFFHKSLFSPLFVTRRKIVVPARSSRHDPTGQRSAGADHSQGG